MARRNRISQVKRERDQKKRERQRRKAEKAAEKRERRFEKSDTGEAGLPHPHVETTEIGIDTTSESEES
jgi:hypothetical protein